MSHSLRILWILVAAMASCSPCNRSSSSWENDAQLRSALRAVQVCQVVSDRFAGSGVWVGKNQLLTARHILLEPTIRVDGIRSDFSIVEQGAGSGDWYTSDWAIVALSASRVESTAAPLGSPCKPVVAGEELFIVGYPATSRESKVQVENLTKTVVRFTVIREPYWTDQSDSTLLYLDGAQSGTYFGLSGAPAVRWNAVDQQLELVGLYLGTIECELFGWRQSAHVVRLAHGMKSLSPLSSVH